MLLSGRISRRRVGGTPRRRFILNTFGRRSDRDHTATLPGPVSPTLAGPPRVAADPVAASALAAGVLPGPVGTTLPGPIGASLPVGSLGVTQLPTELTGPRSIPLLPGEPTLARRVRFAVVNGCTIASLILGVAAIFLAFDPANLRLAAYCLIACVIFDGLDGALARRLGVASPFGAQMDSMADMCAFGVAASVVGYAWIAGAAPIAVILPACALVAVCAAIRLARFNVSPKDGRFFQGVPTTMAAGALALATLIVPTLPAWCQIAGVALLAVAMVSSFPYAKLSRLLRLPPWMLLAPALGFLINYRVTFLAIVVAYLASGPLIWLRTRRSANT